MDALSQANSATASGSRPLLPSGVADNSLLAGTQEQFLTLLLTQLRNQDPLNPMDNAGVTSQIAQLSTVDGIHQLNNTLLALSGQMDLTQSMQAAGLIGKEVLVPGSKVALGSQVLDGYTQKVATPFGVEFIASAASAIVNIQDASGATVRQFETGLQAAGVITFQWDGKNNEGLEVADGAYVAKVNAFDAEGHPVPAQALTSGRVSGVAYSSGGLQVELGLAGHHSLADIRKIM